MSIPPQVAVQPATQVMAVVVPDGVQPGGMFHIQTPTGQTMAVACPAGVTPGQQIQVMAPSGPPALLGLLEKEERVTFGGKGISATSVKKPGDWFSRGWVGEIPVMSGSGTLLGKLHYSTQSVTKEPAQVQFVDASGALLFSYETPGGLTAKELSPIAVQMGGVVYASCAVRSVQAGGGYIHSIAVTRADGSGGSIVAPLEQGCGSTRCTLLTLGLVLWVFVVGVVFVVMAYAMPVTGPVTSLDGQVKYPPHGEHKGKKTLNFVPDPKDKRKDTYAAHDAQTKVDAFLGMAMSAVLATLWATQDGTLRETA